MQLSKKLILAFLGCGLLPVGVTTAVSYNAADRRLYVYDNATLITIDTLIDYPLNGTTAVIQ